MLRSCKDQLRLPVPFFFVSLFCLVVKSKVTHSQRQIMRDLIMSKVHYVDLEPNPLLTSPLTFLINQDFLMTGWVAESFLITGLRES